MAVEDFIIYLHSRGEGLLPTHLSSLWRLAFAKQPFGYCLGVPDWCCRQNRMGGTQQECVFKRKKKRPMSQQQLANGSVYPDVYVPAAQQWCQTCITVGCVNAAPSGKRGSRANVALQMYVSSCNCVSVFKLLLIIVSPPSRVWCVRSTGLPRRYAVLTFRVLPVVYHKSSLKNVIHSYFFFLPFSSEKVTKVKRVRARCRYRLHTHPPSLCDETRILRIAGGNVRMRRWRDGACVSKDGRGVVKHSGMWGTLTPRYIVISHSSSASSS